MTSEPWIERHRRFHGATVAGDVAAMRAAMGDPPDFPNSATDIETGCGDYPLIYALYHGPLSLVRELLALGADPNLDPGDGFPPLHAALDSGQADRLARLELLLAHGADPQQRGFNDFTALHKATCRDDAPAVELLLAHGADPEARTRIDHYETALEHARRWQHRNALAALERGPASAQPEEVKRKPRKRAR